MRRVTLYFGSFNPVHNGHIAIAEYVMTNCAADELWFVLSPQNPLKNSGELASEQDRLAMLELALSESEYGSKLKISTIEFDLPKPSYTVATLDALEAEYPDTEFSILMGEDNFRSINRWREYEKITSSYDIYIYPRGDKKEVTNVHYNTKQIYVLDAAPLLDISATMIRNSDVNNNEYLHSEVIKYIEKNGLYR